MWASDAVESLEKTCGADWPAIRKARQATANVVASIQSALGTFDTPATSIVVTGSVGRRERTSGSDFDWYLLVDGASDARHFELAQAIAGAIVKLGLKAPASNGAFGELVSSHDLVHYIAGGKDSNENLTRRILLLVESRPVTNAVVRERVIRNVLARYVVHDRPVRSRAGGTRSIPHFLLNDVVRYWRTVASDFASKMWERQQEGWGVRNLKLRFSRKLLFVAGLLTAFTGPLFNADDRFRETPDDEFFVLLADLIREATDVSPLDKVATLMASKPSAAKEFFEPYDRFLAALDDENKRKHLERLHREEASRDDVYESLREQSYRFRMAVDKLFFESDVSPLLPDLIRRYGVF